MRQAAALLCLLSVVMTWMFTSSMARKAPREGRYNMRVSTHTSDYPRLRSIHAGMAAAAQVDTFVMAKFSFNPGGIPSAEGWHSADRTGQVDTFWHVADTTDLDGTSFFGAILEPLEGLQSVWVGTSGNTFETCFFESTPSYGNSWSQHFISRPFARSGDVQISYKVRFDTEGGYDEAFLQFKDQNDVWRNVGGINGGIGFYDGTGDLTESIVVPGTSLGDSIQIRFFFTSDGARSGQDGLYTSMGVLLDSLRVADQSGEIDFQDFEAEPHGALQTNDGDWRSTVPESFGDFAGLFPGVAVLQEDPCFTNLSWLWGFFNGSPDDFGCGGHPEQPVVPLVRVVQSPFGAPVNVYAANEIWSPLIDWTEDINGTPVPPTAASARLEFDVYGDMPLDNLVFYRWHVRGVLGGCPISAWDDDNFVHWRSSKDWFRESFELGPFVPPGVAQAQLSIGVFDLCVFWCNVFGSGACHSHGPLIDNVRLIRVDLHGPQWTVGETDLFQDNFATDGSKTGTVRVNTATRLGFPGSIVPGDSVFLITDELNVGLDNHLTGDPNSGAAVYCFVKDVSPSKSGAAISGDLGQWPVVTIPQSQPGWTVLQFDSVVDNNAWPPFSGFSVDLNDNLFTPGDTIYYYFAARDASGNTNFWTQDADVTDQGGAEVTAMEVTCLPANGLGGATDILYVDDADGFGVQPFFDTAFQILGITPDRYDVLAPTSMTGSGPGSRVVDVVQQLAGCYKKIIWNSGGLTAGLIGDGMGNPEFSDDFGMLLAFLDQSPNRPGLYITGDNIAEEWVTLGGGGAVTLRATYMNFTLVGGDHVAAGQSVSPLAVGLAGSLFDHPSGQDTLIAFGGCPVVSDFDVLTPVGTATLAMSYSNNPAHGAVLTQMTQNAVGDTARVVLSGFSYHKIRDDRTRPPVLLDRVEHLRDILMWLDDVVLVPTAGPDAPAPVNHLAQNYPNPFNPTTTIRYSIKDHGRVSLRVYNVAGQLVRTLVDDVRAPRADGFAVTWDGRNEAGTALSSGVYFYKLVTPGFTRTRKMVLLN